MREVSAQRSALSVFRETYTSGTFRACDRYDAAFLPADLLMRLTITD